MKTLWTVVPVLAVLGVLLLCGSSPAAAQTQLEKTLKQFSGDAVSGYIQPAADLFGANMMAGQYRSAAIPAMGFSIAFDIVGMAALIGDDQKTYTAKTPDGFTPSTFKTATIFGDVGTTVANTSFPSLQYRGKDGIITSSVMPLAVPQLRIGSIAGTEAMVRFLTVPKIGDEQFPEITLFGGGIRHSISQYLPMLPLDLAVGAFYTTFKTGDIIDVKGYSLGVHASKTFTLLTVYGGLAYESTTMKISYTSTDPNFPGQLVDVSLDGANTFRATAGLALSLGIFHIFGDANVGSVTHFSGGIGFGL
jgi:Family of unknown function (DUF6588)